MVLERLRLCENSWVHTVTRTVVILERLRLCENSWVHTVTRYSGDTGEASVV